MINALFYIFTLFFIGILYHNLNKDTEGLTEDEIENMLWWDVFGPIIAIAAIQIIGILYNIL